MNLKKATFALCLLSFAFSAAATDRLSFRGESDGGKIYVQKCAKCHELHPPSEYSQPEWDKWMSKMRRKSKLKPNDFQAVQEYTQALRDGSTVPQRRK
jgi:mono/diheme cytochrome c family protein